VGEIRIKKAHGFFGGIVSVLKSLPVEIYLCKVNNIVSDIKKKINFL